MTTFILAILAGAAAEPSRPCLPGAAELNRPVAAWTMPLLHKVRHEHLNPTAEQLKKSRSNPPPPLIGELQPCDPTARIQRGAAAPAGDTKR